MCFFFFLFFSCHLGTSLSSFLNLISIFCLVASPTNKSHLLRFTLKRRNKKCPDTSAETLSQQCWYQASLRDQGSLIPSAPTPVTPSFNISYSALSWCQQHTSTDQRLDQALSLQQISPQSPYSQAELPARLILVSTVECCFPRPVVAKVSSSFYFARCCITRDTTVRTTSVGPFSAHENLCIYQCYWNEYIQLQKRGVSKNFLSA